MPGPFLTSSNSCRTASAGGPHGLLRLAASVWLMLGCLMLFGATQARSQPLEPVELNVSEEEGYGRIVLTFKDRTLLPIYDAVITGGVLRISFEEPIDINVDDVPLDLGDYVTIARRDPDGSAIRFALKNQYQINTLEAGEKLFVDILPMSWQGLPPGLPDDVVRDLAKRAEEAMRKVRALEQARLKAQEGPEVTLHVGEHPTFTRLVFDWSIKFDTAFVRENDIIKVTFNHPAQLDIAHLRAHLPQGVIDATSFLDQGKLKFLMRVEPSVDIRAFREEQTYVIDVTPENMEVNDPANALINKELSVEDNENRKDMISAQGLRDTREVKNPRGLPPAGATTTASGGVLKESTADESPAYTVLPIGDGSGNDGAQAPAVAPARPEGQQQAALPRDPHPEAGPAVEQVEPRIAMAPRPKPVLVAAGPPPGEDQEGAPSIVTTDIAAAGPDETTTAPAVETLPAPEVVATVTPSPTGEAAGEDGLTTATIPPVGTVTTASAPPGRVDAAQAEIVVAQAEPGAMPLGDPMPEAEEIVREAPMLDLSQQSIEEPQEVDAPENNGIPTLEPTEALNRSAQPNAPYQAEPVQIQNSQSLGGSDVPAGIKLPDQPKAEPEVWRATGGNDVDKMPPSPEKPPASFAEEVRNFVSAEARRIGNTVRVVFPFSEPVSSAVFRRNDSIWLVFDTDATIDTRGMVSALAETAETIEVQQFDDYQILRLDMNDPVLATVGVDGNAWSLVIGDLILEPSRPLQLERNVRGDGGSVLRVLYQDPQNIRQVTDPFVGDAISLVTGFGPPRGLLKPQNFVDLDALSSAQGIAIVSKSDGVKMKILGDDVIIEKEGGLALSNNYLRGGTGALNNIVDPEESGYVEFVSLSTEGPGAYRSRLLELQNKLSKAPEGRRRKPLMALARFYLAHQFAQEALGLMKLALEEEPALAEDSNFNLMMGAAQTMADRPDEAFAHLNRPDLKNSPDAAVWQTIVDVKLGNWTSARIAMPRGRAVVGNYPPAIQTEFKLAAAQAMVEVNDFGVANSVLAEIEPAEVTRTQAARYDILRGRVADASGRSQEALTVFDLVTRSDDRPRAAEAEYRALRIRYRDGELTVDETLDQLAGLATSWRGDEIELKTLRFLAQLNAERGHYREAFEAMKSAVQAEPDSDTTRLLQEEMNGLFNSLFLDGKADEMPPVKALALYYDFREMTPIGRQGDEMVRLLAKRLVEVDLLDQATELLRHQVDNRLKGAARAQIAADLAAIYLMDRKAEEALRVLNRTRQASLPSTLERQRNIVEARALTESGRPDLALELVRNMRGSDVDRLRADTFWAAESWRDAGEQLEAMHGSRWSDNIPLEDLERRDILRAAIAYSLAGDQLSLQRLKTKYMTKMADSSEALAFEVVTRPVEAQGVEFLEVANRLADTDSLETFLQEYRRQYMSPDRSPDQSAAAPGPEVAG